MSFRPFSQYIAAFRLMPVSLKRDYENESVNNDVLRTGEKGENNTLRRRRRRRRVSSMLHGK